MNDFVGFFSPTWINHYAIFQYAKNIVDINMYDRKKNGFMLEQALDGIKTKLQPGSALLLQACAQNPTGVDPSEEEWVAISRACKDRKIFPMIDSAYLGFVSGNVVKDAFPLRLFVEDGHTFAFNQSFSKNLGLYGERIGAIHFVCPNKSTARAMTSYFRQASSIYPPIAT